MAVPDRTCGRPPVPRGAATVARGTFGTLTVVRGAFATPPPSRFVTFVGEDDAVAELIGRHAELSRFRGLLGEEQFVAVLNVTGMAGIGK